MTTRRPTSVFDLEQHLSQGMLTSAQRDAVRRIYHIEAGPASCTVGPQLSAKYGLPQDNEQTVLCVTNMISHEQVWYNRIRSLKPQLFTGGMQGVVDPTCGGGPAKCDFCDWHTLTANDAWGRHERAHAVTASNLFKYAQPFHGLALFKHHDPLTWTPEQLRDLLLVSADWFRSASAAAAAAEPAAVYSDGLGAAAAQASPYVEASTPAPSQAGSAAAAQAAHPPPLQSFFLWNALARAGASQFHGHAQLMATHTPVPAQSLLAAHSRQYQQAYPGRAFLLDVLAAHAAAGLLCVCEEPHTTAHGMPGTSSSSSSSGSNGRGTMGCEAGTGPALPASPSMRGAQGEDGVSSSLGAAAGRVPPGGGAAAGSRARRAWVAAHLCPRKDMELLVVAEQQEGGLANPAFGRALHCGLRALVDSLGVQSFNVGILNLPPATHTHHPAVACPGVSDAAESRDFGGATSVTLEAWQQQQPHPETPLMLARVVSRGRATQTASDFGGLEVFGGASIGHMDPYTLMQAVEAQFAQQPAWSS